MVGERKAKGQAPFLMSPNQLPFPYAIDYAGLCSLAPEQGTQGLIDFLHAHLPIRWREVYATTTSHVTNIVEVRRGTFEYLCDVYSGLEAVGEVPFDQRVKDRVIGVLGISVARRRTRRGSFPSGWLELPEELAGCDRDNGHFIAHCIGGGLDVNIFSQSRELNRGFSERGKIYRQMEKYCYANPGTFCFSRPVYPDETSVPRWIEFGVMMPDNSMWIEVFEN
jgi:hypothetical protein